MNKPVSATLVALMVFLFGAARAAVASEGAEADRAAIHAAAKQYVAAMQRGDTETLRAMWTPEGDYMDAAGTMTKAKDLFPEHAASASAASEPAEVSAWESSLRFITPDVAIEDGGVEVGTSADGSVLSKRFSVVWVKRDGRWLIDSLREAASASPSIRDRLSQLGWLIGEWVAKTDDSEILVSSDWSENGNFIVREFLIRGEGREPLSGTERIGWDHSAGKLKSWIFDSLGGSGEGYWRRDSDRWILESKEVMPDGKQATAALVYTPQEDGSFLWEVTSASVDGKKLPTQRAEFQRAK